MALTAEQRWSAAKIDTRMQKLIRAGKDDMTIVAAMADHMLNAKQLLGTIQLADLDELTRKFPGFYRYAKILESLAAGIRSGAIPVPGREAAPQQTTAMSGHRQRAAAIDLRMRQLAEEAVPRPAIIGRMVAHVADLGAIWNATTDEQLAALCDEYPGFHTYAVLMEEAAEAERRKPARPYDDLPDTPRCPQTAAVIAAQHRRQAGMRLSVRARCRRHIGGRVIACAAQPAACRVGSRSDTLQRGTPGRRRAAEITRHRPAPARPHGAADRQTQSPSPGVMTGRQALRGWHPDASYRI